ncbi:hypothetical protein [Curtobacterium sp. ISL-83]|uniref:hypothetical protein n=1 Tax=Curtobacterium sp. ISL-83 TaxID=2819145 RepID=UPI001BEB13F4|nr:hypothetical protein [Curtobacterium sp. ISL-83]MBT2504100.1 hypothetical protein [Curtobacterium sp. ISL-83]
MSAPEHVVTVGGWEHDCCGLAIEIGDVVEYSVVSGNVAGRYEAVRHGTVPTFPVRGRVLELYAVGVEGRVALRRVPSGRALRGFDDDDDGHLEARWTGQRVEVVFDGERWFDVVIDPSSTRQG